MIHREGLLRSVYLLHREPQEEQLVVFCFGARDVQCAFRALERKKADGDRLAFRDSNSYPANVVIARKLSPGHGFCGFWGFWAWSGRMTMASSYDAFCVWQTHQR